jgi:hypothetical protein
MKTVSTAMSHAKTNPQIVLRPEDLVVLLRLLLAPDGASSYAVLAGELGGDDL